MNEVRELVQIETVKILNCKVVCWPRNRESRSEIIQLYYYQTSVSIYACCADRNTAGMGSCVVGSCNCLHLSQKRSKSFLFERNVQKCQRKTPGSHTVTSRAPYVKIKISCVRFMSMWCGFSVSPYHKIPVWLRVCVVGGTWCKYNWQNASSQWRNQQ